MAEYVHSDGHREVTVDGSVRDQQLAAKARDGRTSWQRAEDVQPATEQGE